MWRPFRCLRRVEAKAGRRLCCFAREDVVRGRWRVKSVLLCAVKRDSWARDESIVVWHVMNQSAMQSIDGDAIYRQFLEAV
eukprot:6214674-Pleurochrysis_carterae.AAC.1